MDRGEGTRFKALRDGLNMAVVAAVNGGTAGDAVRAVIDNVKEREADFTP